MLGENYLNDLKPHTRKYNFKVNHHILRNSNENFQRKFLVLEIIVVLKHHVSRQTVVCVSRGLKVAFVYE